MPKETEPRTPLSILNHFIDIRQTVKFLAHPILECAAGQNAVTQWVCTPHYSVTLLKNQTHVHTFPLVLCSTLTLLLPHNGFTLFISPSSELPLKLWQITCKGVFRGT